MATERPNVQDFYPQGKLYSIKIPSNIPLSSEILKKYSTNDINAKAQQTLLHDIILASSEWAKQIKADSQMHTSSRNETYKQEKW